MKTPLIIAVSFVSSGLMAQSNTATGRGDAEPTFQEIRSKFNSIFSERPVPKGTGFNKFRRWEAYWEPRVEPDGRFPDADVLRREWEEYSNDHPDLRGPSAKAAANWTEAGPSTFTFAGFGGIGRVNCIGFHPSIATTFWAGTPAGGLWKTVDGGASWTTTTDDLPVLGISDIVVHPTDPDIMYIATGDAETALVVPSSTKSIGVLKSADGGVTWTPTGLNMNVVDQRLIGRLLMNPADPQILLAAASDGLWRTTDGGATWTNTAPGWFIDMEFKPGDPQIIYASTLSDVAAAQIFRSANGGLSWTQATNFSGVSRIAVAVSANAPGHVTAVCADMVGLGGLEGIYTSQNSGASFVQSVDGDCTNNLLNRVHDAMACGGQGVFDLACAIDPTDASERWIGGINLWRTSNGGAQWALNTMWTQDPILNPNGKPFLHSDKHCIAFHPLSPSVVFVGSDGGLHATNDNGITWYDLSNGMGISQMYKVGVAATEPDRILCGLQDNGLKQLENGQWTDHIPGDHMECIIDPIDADVQYSCALTGILYRTTDNWASRTLIANNIPGFSAFMQQNGYGPGAWVTPVAMHPVDHETLYVGFKELWKTSDQGDTWVAISNTGSTAPLRSLAVAPSNDQVIFTATYDTLYRTINGGATWLAVPIGSITGNGSNVLSSITVSATDPLRLWVTVSGYDASHKVLSSMDGGLTWTNISGTLPNIPVNCGVYENGSDDGLYVGTDVGVFHRDATMPDWEAFNTGLPNVQVDDLKIAYINGTLWAATFGRGLWRTELSTLTGLQEPSSSGVAFTIAPDPSDGAFNVTLQDRRADRIEVISTTGERVFSSPILGSVIHVDLRHVAAGTYVVKVLSVTGDIGVQRVVKR